MEWPRRLSKSSAHVALAGIIAKANRIATRALIADLALTLR
jgi:hypothetical protein